MMEATAVAPTAASPTTPSATTTVVIYNGRTVDERTNISFEEALPTIDLAGVTWIHLSGRPSEPTMQALAERLEIEVSALHRLFIKTKRSTFEMVGSHVVILLRFLHQGPRAKHPKERSLFMILGKGFVVTICDKEDGCFEPVKGRIRNPQGICRKSGPDYLVYMILDTIVDNYFLWIEKIDLQVAQVENMLMNNNGDDIHSKVYHLKRQAANLRRSIWPLREVLSNLQRSESPLLTKTTMAQIVKVYNHALQAIDSIESLQDMLSSLMDLHLSHVSQKMNEVMKLLAIVSTTFVPLTFIVGIYGMNFKNMPELECPWGYPVLWIVIGTVFGTMLYLFKRKRWI